MADAFRQEWGRITAALIHQTGDWDLAEECAQDAFTQALRRWPRDGVPNRPGAWLMTVARNGAIDRLRRGSAYRAKVEELAVMAARETGTGNPGPHLIHTSLMSCMYRPRHERAFSVPDCDA